MELSEKDINQLNAFENFLSWEVTDIFKKYINCPHKVVGLFTGNQSMKTSSTAYQYVLRILGWHPVPEKNILYFVCNTRYCKNGHGTTNIPEDWKCEECGEEVSKFSGHKYTIKTRPEDNICTKCSTKLEIYKRNIRIFRFASHTLPNEKGDTGDGGASAETKNTQYPEFKKWLPSFLIKKDITARIFNMRILDPNDGRTFGDLVYKGTDIIVEFVSYNQGAEATAGVQRTSIWLDEEAPQEFYEEQGPRLLAENGDKIITLTPANFITWTYDEIFEKAKVYYRSKIIVDYLNREGGNAKQREHMDSIHNIAVIQAATDDNPTLSGDVIEEMFSNVDDPDKLAIRRYGIFKQVSGRIFKDFEYNVHFINKEKYFPDGMPHDRWVHARAIDYHSQTPWACTNVSLSPTNEVFIWREFNPSPEKMTTREIAREFALMGKDYDFRLNLIDPFAKATSKDNITVLDDLNRAFYDLKMENIGRGGYWQPWDTKGEKGRDAIRERLKNAKEVGKPFNNTVVRKGQKVNIPTVWVLSDCKIMAQSMRQWRWEEWADSRSRSQKDAKNKPMQKWSHMCMAVEAILKESAFRPSGNYSQPKHKSYGYFQSRGR